MDVQVYNAGILSPRPFFELPVEEWDRVFAVNARGTFLCVQTVGRHMREQRGGSIVNVASTGPSNVPLASFWAMSRTKRD